MLKYYEFCEMFSLEMDELETQAMYENYEENYTC